MTLGEKIKKARKEKELTQSELVKDYMTRNMLSCIESGKSTPSLETLTYISKRLDLPISYFLSNEDRISYFTKPNKMSKIKELYKAKVYSECISELESLGEPDDEIALLLTECCMLNGRELLMNGQFLTAEEQFRKSLEFAEKTVYNTTSMTAKIPMYLSICKNIHAPLLEFDQKDYELSLDQEMDFEFYKYMSLDYNYNYKNKAYSSHLLAKKHMKEKRFTTALEILGEIVENNRGNEYNAYLMFWVYFDMENSYRQLLDFENAYRYANKRLSLIEGFKT